MNSHGEMFANLFLDLFLLAAVAGTLSSLGRVCDSMHERGRERERERIQDIYAEKNYA